METARAQAGDYANPILKPQAATAVKKHGENSLRGIVDPDPHTQCWPEPIPFALSVQFGMEMLQAKRQPDCCLSLRSPSPARPHERGASRPPHADLAGRFGRSL